MPCFAVHVKFSAPSRSVRFKHLKPLRVESRRRSRIVAGSDLKNCVYSKPSEVRSDGYFARRKLLRVRVAICVITVPPSSYREQSSFSDRKKTCRRGWKNIRRSDTCFFIYFFFPLFFPSFTLFTIVRWLHAIPPSAVNRFGQLRRFSRCFRHWRDA
jgi:hypothetical protein